jgi:putative FmdB family regulatory protein
LPIYNYTCPSGHKLERKEHYNSDAVINCSKCDQKMIRQIGHVVVHFKGEGWAGPRIR